MLNSPYNIKPSWISSLNISTASDREEENTEGPY